MKKSFLIILFLFLNSSFVFSQFSDSDINFIVETFAQVHELCSIDNGKMWGISLDLPCMVIDKNTRKIIANSPDKNGLLICQGNFYTGTYPENEQLGNSFTEFGGTVFAFVTFPFLFPESYLKVQLIHEMFHIVQDSLNLNPPHTLFNNAHMDESYARIYLRLEWAALEKAILSKNDEEKATHIQYALKFRKKRRLMFKDISKEENYFELKEGMSEYTGHIISSNTFNDYIKSIQAVAEIVKPLDSYATNFAYYSGCLYGGLLYSYDKDWNHSLHISDDLGEKLRDKCTLPNIDTLLNIEFINQNYKANEITKEEVERRKQKQKLILKYKHTFFEDTVLVLTLENWGMQMFPTDIIPLDTLGMVHQKIILNDNWGKLTVNTGGCLLNGNKASVPAKNLKVEGNKIYTDNWEILLEDNWSLEMINGNYNLWKR